MYCIEIMYVLYLDNVCTVFQDKYILISMGILCSVCVWHSVLPALIARYDYTPCYEYDRIVLAVLGVVFILFHLTFIVKILLVVSTKCHC